MRKVAQAQVSLIFNKEDKKENKMFYKMLVLLVLVKSQQKLHNLLWRIQRWFSPEFLTTLLCTIQFITLYWNLLPGYCKSVHLILVMQYLNPLLHKAD